MDLALETSMTINGYKGPSPAVNLPHFDLVWGFTVEYMHGVLLGVTRQITELLLSSTNSNERFYIGKFEGIIKILHFWRNSIKSEKHSPEKICRFGFIRKTQNLWIASCFSALPTSIFAEP